MFPRSLTVAIVVFWLAMTSLFVYHDVWPTLNPLEPILYPIELIDEAGQQGVQTNWSVYRNKLVDGRSYTYTANVEWKYNEPKDYYESNCKLNLSGSFEGSAPKDQIRPFFPVNLDMESKYHIVRGGQMESFQTDTSFSILGQSVWTWIEGKPARGQFIPRFMVEPVRQFAKEKDADPPGPKHEGQATSLSPRGLILNPLHPCNQIFDIREGQQWRMSVVDPLALATMCALWAGPQPAAHRAHAGPVHLCFGGPRPRRRLCPPLAKGGIYLGGLFLPGH